MTQKSYFWDGASLGDANYAPYHLSNEDYESPFVDLFLRCILNGDEDRGVLSGWANELEATCAGGTTPVAVNSGGAVIYGMPYENTASLNVAITTPTTDTRYDRIVVRRNWAAQTARITLITGTEGGSAPAMTQSPAPDGSGIYDIPLAIVETDTGGNISVTDAREYCEYRTVVRDGAFDTAHIQDNSVDFADRATRTKRMFFGGGDLQPAVTAGRFEYLYSYYTDPMSGTPTWGGSADEEGWIHTGTGYRGVYAGFGVPPDYAGGTMSTYIWWANNTVEAASFTLYTAYQTYIVGTGNSSGTTGGKTETAISASGAVSDVFRSAGVTIISTLLATDTNWFNYFASFYNTAGTESINILGVEVVYTGYT